MNFFSFFQVLRGGVQGTYPNMSLSSFLTCSMIIYCSIMFQNVLGRSRRFQKVLICYKRPKKLSVSQYVSLSALRNIDADSAKLMIGIKIIRSMQHIMIVIPSHHQQIAISYKAKSSKTDSAYILNSATKFKICSDRPGPYPKMASFSCYFISGGPLADQI